MHSCIGLCIAMYSCLGLCIAVYSSVQLCIAVYTYVGLCTAMYTRVELCIAMHSCVGLDDLMTEGGEDKALLDLFTKRSHHQNITVLYLCEDMFPPGKYAKSISRNAHYIVAFKNPRDQLGMKNLLLQAFPTCWQDM